MSQKIKGGGLALAFLFLFWHLTALYLNRPFLPYPLPVLKDFIQLSLQENLSLHFLTSTYRVVISLIISFLLAVPLGFVLGRSPSLDRIIAPLIYVLFPLPKIVFLPIIIILLGLGNLPKIFLISLIVFFQILITARDAAKNIPRQWVLSMKSLHASSWQIYYHLVWPSSFPKILTSVRVSLGTAIAVLFLTETFASNDGLGYFILDTMERKDFTAMYSGILAMGLLGIITYSLVDLLENTICRWTKL